MQNLNSVPDLAATKQVVRSELKQARAALSAADRAQFSGQISARLRNLPEVQRAESVFAFISYGNEVDTHGLLQYFLDKGTILAVPKILPEQGMVAIRLHSWDDLVPAQMGILTPRENGERCDSPEVIITPGLGFTREGYRIGYGRGYYDRWFSQHTAGLKIGIAFEAQIRNDLPVDDRDVPVDIIVTEKQLINTRE